MDLETFFTTVYVLVDDWYKTHIAPYKPKRPGVKPRMSDSEVLSVAIAGQWQVGVPWRSERGLVRYMRAHGIGMFPTMLNKSEFNARVRDLWGAFVQMQQVVADLLKSPEDAYVCADSEPLPAFSGAQALRDKSHWLFESTLGLGGNWAEFFIGDHLFAVVTPSGAITGWLLGTAYIQDRWLLEALLSARAGCPQLVGPPRDPHRSFAEHPRPPIGHIGPLLAAGHWANVPYLTDQGFNGERWISHWRSNYQAIVINVPPWNTAGAATWSRHDKRWLAHHRQIIDTTFAFLDGVFGVKHLNAHSRWGQYARVAAKIAAYNIGIFINLLLARPAHSFETLLC